MLVYVNKFELKDDSDLDLVFEYILKWLNKKVDNQITLDDLKTVHVKELKGKKGKLEVNVFFEKNQKLYSISFSHLDRKKKGREWITEIGISFENGIKSISILLKTFENSTKIEKPDTTKPELVNFLQRCGIFKCDDKPILISKIDDVYKLKEDILRENRCYPIVLVSKRSKTKEYLIELNMLEKQLIGLAKIFIIDGVSSYDVEDILSKEYCAWDGAVRIIYPIKQNKTYLFRSYELDNLKNRNKKLTQEILSYIVHLTNREKFMAHISPLLVKKKIYERDNRDNKEYKDLLELYLEDKEELQKENMSLKLKIKEMNNEIEKLRYTKESLINKSTNSSKSDKPLLYYGNEIDLYENEIPELIIKSIEFYSKAQQLNSNSRQKVILNDILEHNISNNKADFLKKQLQKAFKAYEKVDAKLEKTVNELGFEIKKTKGHNELKFIRDNRFKVIFSSSPSDKVRAGKKISNDIDKELLY